MASPRHNANGHRRRELRARVLAEETLCALCDTPVDKTLGMSPGKHGPRCTPTSNTPGTSTTTHRPGCTGCVPHPKRAEVDEDIPRSRGGSPYDRHNCRLMHRDCNQWKGAQTLTEARQRLHNGGAKHIIKASPIW